MSTGIIVTIVIFSAIAWILITFLGYCLSNEQNAIGVLLLFISLNIFGLILGICIIWNHKNNTKIAKRWEKRVLKRINKYNKKCKQIEKRTNEKLSKEFDIMK